MATPRLIAWFDPLLKRWQALCIVHYQKYKITITPNDVVRRCRLNSAFKAGITCRARLQWKRTTRV